MGRHRIEEIQPVSVDRGGPPEDLAKKLNEVIKAVNELIIRANGQNRSLTP